MASGQSGRRSPISPPTTPSTSTSKQDETIKPPEPGLRLRVARQPSSKRLASEDAIYAAFFKRLSEFEGVGAESIGDLSHKEAVKRAKEEDQCFIILLQFEIDSFQRGTILLDSPDLEVKYVVLAPLTGKRQSRGKIYYQSLSGPKLRRDNWPKGPPIKLSPETAGIEAAEMVWEWISIQLHAKRNK